MKVTLAVAVPAMSFLVLNDTVQGFYGPNRDLPLSYVVVEEEEPLPEEETAPAEDEAAIMESAVEENVEVTEVEPETAEGAVEDVATAEEPVADDAAVEETALAEDTTAEDAPTEDAAAAEEPAVDDESTEVAMLSPEEMEAGETAARACASCHQFDRERNAAGPHLVGLNGRTIGSVDGFRYSNALQDLNAEGQVWDMETLQVWLENPDAFAEGTRMMYQVQDAEERRLIAGWLTQRDN